MVCQELALGASAGVAYRRAGYVLRGRAAEAGAARLAGSAEVTRRMRRLVAGNAASAEGASSDVTVATSIRELEEARRLAMAKKQPAPAVSVALGKAKIGGLAVDKSESRADARPTFEGADTDAARRIAFPLRLGGIEPTARQSLERPSRGVISDRLKRSDPQAREEAVAMARDRTAKLVWAPNPSPLRVHPARN